MIDDPHTLIAPGIVSAVLGTGWIWLRQLAAKGALEITSRSARTFQAEIARLETDLATEKERADRAEACEACARERADNAIDRLLSTLEALRVEVRNGNENGKDNNGS